MIQHESLHKAEPISIDNLRIDVGNVVFHSLRHTSAGVKLKLSKGDLKAVQGDGGWNTPDMVTKRYAHILDEDRKTVAGGTGLSRFISKFESRRPPSRLFDLRRANAAF